MDKKEILPCAAFLEGEYGVTCYYFAVPVMVGAGGVEKVIEMELGPRERKLFDESLGHRSELVGAMDMVLKA
jgi:malate dehydrogenase